jgi:hypothetical protein
MEQIHQHLRERFPLLTRLRVQGPNGNVPAETLPLYLGMLLAAMEAPPAPPLCFVFPRRGDVGRIAAILYCLARLKQRHRDLIRQVALDHFKSGQLVRIHPSQEVFVYEGVRLDDPDHFWLSELDLSRPNAGYRTRFPVRMNFPLGAIQRLEPTEAKRPKGDIRSRARELQTPPPAPIDHLLDTATFGNLAALTNELLLLDSQGGFFEFVGDLFIQPGISIDDMPAVRDALPLGKLVQPTLQARPGFRAWDETCATGEPVIAVTSSDETLANFCIDAPVRSKLVIVNGLSRLRSLQAYDDIAETQKLILFADHNDEEMIEALAKRGCRFWDLGKAELLAGMNGNGAHGVIGSVSHWARNYEHLQIDDEPCEDSQLDEVCLRLEKFHGVVSRGDDGPLARLVGRAWRLFGDACSAIEVPGAEERSRALAELDRFRTEIRGNAAWLAPESTQILIDIADLLTRCHGPDSKLGRSKGAAIYHALKVGNENGDRIALIARNENKVTELRSWLYRRGLQKSVEVFSIRTLPDDQQFSRLLVVSWPGGDTLKEAVAKLSAPHVTLVGYPCERRWLRQCRPRFHRRSQVTALNPKEKAALVSGTAGPGFNWPEESPSQTTSAGGEPTADIWTFERQLRSARIGLAARPTEATDTLQARYVRFSGNFYAFLTETHKVPVATDLVSGRARPNQKLPERAISDIKSGDFVVFPESGDRELVQELADKLIGPTAAKLRKLARLWKEALQTSGQTPEDFLRHARNLNRPRHPATIRHWFADTSQIGPREKEDLVLIALATGNQRLNAEIEDVRLAIERLWSSHLSAGMRLRDVLLQRLPQVIGQIEEGGTQVDLAELGSAWVVQVESIAADSEPRGRGEVNRLLSEDSTPSTPYLL